MPLGTEESKWAMYFVPTDETEIRKGEDREGRREKKNKKINNQKEELGKKV